VLDILESNGLTLTRSTDSSPFSSLATAILQHLSGVFWTSSLPEAVESVCKRNEEQRIQLRILLEKKEYQLKDANITTWMREIVSLLKQLNFDVTGLPSTAVCCSCNDPLKVATTRRALNESVNASTDKMILWKLVLWQLVLWQFILWQFVSRLEQLIFHVTRLLSIAVYFSCNYPLEVTLNESVNASTDKMILWQDPETKLFCNVTRCSLAFEDLSDYVRPLIGQVSTLYHFFYAKLDVVGDDEIEMLVDALIQEMKNCRTAVDYVRAFKELGIKESDKSYLILKKLAAVNLNEEELADMRADIWQSIQLALDDCHLRRRRDCETAMQREEDTIMASEKRNHEMKKSIAFTEDEIKKDEQDIEQLSALLVAEENKLKQEAVQVDKAKTAESTVRQVLSQVQTAYQLKQNEQKKKEGEQLAQLQRLREEQVNQLTKMTRTKHEVAFVPETGGSRSANPEDSVRGG
jgi:hypothetical protein